MAGNAGAHHFRRRDGFLVAGVGSPGKGDFVQGVHFLRGQGRSRAGQHHGAVAHGLKGPGVQPVYLAFQFLRHGQQFDGISQDFIVCGQGHAGGLSHFLGQVGRAWAVWGLLQLVQPRCAGYAAQIFSGVQPLGAFQGGAFAHAPDEQVGLGVHKNGLAQRVCPEVVMAHAPQAALDAAKHKGQAGKSPARQIGVYQAGPVGARARLTARGVGVIMALFAKGRVVGQQGIQRSGTDASEQARSAHDQQVVGIFPARLGHNACAIAVVDQPAGQQHAAEGRVIHIGVAGDEEHVQTVPAERVHFCCAHGHKEGLFPVRQRPGL